MKPMETSKTHQNEPMKTKTQANPKSILPRDLAEVENLVGHIAAARNHERALTAQMDDLLTAIRQRYEPQLLELAGQIESMHGAVQSWAEANPDRFAPRKSLDLCHGTIGFRTGNPRLKTVARRT